MEPDMHVRHVARLCVMLLLALPVVAVAAPVPAAPADGWSRPRVLDPRDGTSSYAPTYATDGSGQTVVAWVSRTVVQPAAQVWEEPVVRSDIRVRRVGRDGQIGPARTAYSSLFDVQAVKVAMDARGDLVVGWTEYREETAGSRPWVRRVPRRGAPSPPQLVWGESSETFLEDVSMTPDGTAVVTWLEPRLDPAGATLPRRMLLRRVRDDGSLSGVTDLQMTGNTADVVAGDNAFWVSGIVEPIDTSGSTGAIGVVRVDRHGRVEARRTLDPGPTTARPGLESSAPRLTLDARQDARVVWIRYDSVRGGNDVVGRLWRAGGGAGRETVIRSGPYAPTSIATDARGDSFVTWVSVDGIDPAGSGRAWDRRGRLGRVQGFGQIAWEKPYTTVVHGPTAWVDDTGRGIVAWGPIGRSTRALSGSPRASPSSSGLTALATLVHSPRGSPLRKAARHALGTGRSQRTIGGCRGRLWKTPSQTSRPPWPRSRGSGPRPRRARARRRRRAGCGAPSWRSRRGRRRRG